MGAFVGATRTKLTGFVTLLEELLDTVETRNTKDWNEVLVEIAQDTAGNTTYGAIANPANESTAKTGSLNSISTTRLDTWITASEALYTSFMNVQVALQQKDWVNAERLIPAFFTASIAVGTAVTGITANPDTAAQGASFVQSNLAVVNLGFVISGLDRIVVAQNEKNYTLVNSELAEARRNLGNAAVQIGLIVNNA